MREMGASLASGEGHSYNAGSMDVPRGLPSRARKARIQELGMEAMHRPPLLCRCVRYVRSWRFSLSMICWREAARPVPPVVLLNPGSEMAFAWPSKVLCRCPRHRIPASLPRGRCPRVPCQPRSGLGGAAVME